MDTTCSPSTSSSPPSYASLVDSIPTTTSDDHIHFYESRLVPEHSHFAKSLICPISDSYLIDPNSAAISVCCTKLFCQKCIQQWINSKPTGKATCPICRKPLTISTQIPLALISIMDNIHIKCTNQPLGCNYTGNSTDTTRHETQKCKFSPTKCPMTKYGCKWQGTNSTLQAHLDSPCKLYSMKEVLNALQIQINNLVSQLSTNKQSQPVNTFNLDTIWKLIIHKQYQTAWDLLLKEAGNNPSNPTVYYPLCILSDAGLDKFDPSQTYHFLHRGKNLGCILCDFWLKDDARYDKIPINPFEFIHLYHSIKSITPTNSFARHVLWDVSIPDLFLDNSEYIPEMEALAETQNPLAQEKLASCFLYGWGVEKSYPRTLELLHASVNNKNSSANHILGWMHENGEGVPKSDPTAFKLYSQAVEAGHPYSMHNIACMYSEGQGVEKDLKQAFKYYQKAAHLGNPAAMNTLGWCHSTGNGTPVDKVKSLYWYSAAAESGVPYACANVGRFYHNGTATPKNITKAAEYYRKAYMGGIQSAKTNLQNLNLI